jgi:hypothetical protein
MFRLTLPGFAATLLALTFLPDPAQAQRVFVAAQGSDANPCTFALPCRTFQHAHDTVAAGGEINVLDPAGYGVVTITKAISIEGHGFSGISVPSAGTGITINAGTTDAIILRGLTLDGAGTGYDGIVLNSGGSLTISDCVAHNFVYDGSNLTTGNGILIAPTAGKLIFAITDTAASNNGTAGISYHPPSGAPVAKGAVDRVVATNNFEGVAVFAIPATSGSLVIGISNTTVTGNSIAGIDFENFGSSTITVSIDNIHAAGNAAGIAAEGTLSVVLGRSVITGNQIGVGNDASAFYTYKDNRINLNNNDITGTALNTTLVLQ